MSSSSSSIQRSDTTILNPSSKKGSAPANISSLPDEIICHILSFLPKKECESTVRVSSLWRKLTLVTCQNDPEIEYIVRVYIRDISNTRKIESLIEKKEYEKAAAYIHTFTDTILQKKYVIRIFDAMILPEEALDDSEKLQDLVIKAIDNMVYNNKSLIFITKYAFQVLSALGYYTEALKVAERFQKQLIEINKQQIEPLEFVIRHEKLLEASTQRLIAVGDLAKAAETAQSLVGNKTKYFSQIFNSYVDNEDFENGYQFFLDNIFTADFFSFDNKTFLELSLTELLKMSQHFIDNGDFEEALTINLYLKKNSGDLYDKVYSENCKFTIETLRKNKSYEESLLLCICYDFSKMDELHLAFLTNKQERLEKAREIFKKARDCWCMDDENYYIEVLAEMCRMLGRDKEKSEASRLIATLDSSDRRELLQTMFGEKDAFRRYNSWLSF